jgi:peptidylprolyl isomerase
MDNTNHMKILQYRTYSKIFILFFFILSVACSSGNRNQNTVVLMKTSMGEIRLRLFDNTPVHRDNFIKLVSSGFYEGISFHRVINKFMIQAGDPLTRTIPITKEADSLNTYTIPAEFNSVNFHKRGALAAAREGNDVNPEMRSSGTHFYIVQGTVLNDEDLAAAEMKINSGIRQALFNRLIKQIADSALKSGVPMTESAVQDQASVRMFNYLTSVPAYKIPEEHMSVYKSIGGVPRLDQTYTVFGEVLEGMDVVDKIAAVATDASDKPMNDIKIIKIKIIN